MNVLREARHALRTIARSPAYALTCIAVLTLGIAANTSIFSIVYSVILAPLPYADTGRLVFVWERFQSMPEPLGSRMQVARRNYLEWKKQNTVFSAMAAFHETRLSETGVDQPRHISVGSATAGFFPLLGVNPQFGRLFPGEGEKDAERVAIITGQYFQRRFNGDLKALGRPLAIGGVTYTIIGILPENFHLPAMWEGMDQKKPDVWVPLARLWKKPADDTVRQLFVVAKLKPGVTLTQARSEMSRISEGLAQADPQLNAGSSSAVYTFEVEDTAPTLHRALYVLLAAVVFLLLIACANLANLTLARSSERSRDVAVRLALGATRPQIVRQLLLESLILSVIGAAAGLLLAYWAIRGMLALEPVEFQRPELIEISIPVFVFTAAISILAALLFGLAPAVNTSRVDLNSAMKAGGGWGGSAGRSRSRQFLIAAEVALALILVSGAGLMIRSFRELVDTGIGFKTDRLTTVDIDLPETRYPDGASRSRFFRELLHRARSASGVAAASVVDNLPLHRVSATNFYIAGHPEPDKDSLPIADFAQASPDYLSMIGMRLLAGRFFTENDLSFNEKEKDGVAIVNQAWVRKFLDGGQALGKRILSSDKKRAFEIVGVVSDYRPMGVENGPRPQIFSPNLTLGSATLIVRTTAPPQSMVKPVQAVIASLDKELPASKVETMDNHLHYWLSQREFNTLLMTVFAVLALLLAMIGVYGVLANMVASRTREIGIRMAIGASFASIARLILAQGMVPVFAGLAVGLAGSIALSRFLQSLLFQVRADDPVTRILAVCAILLITPVAIFIPLQRALRVNCTDALREE
jgi:putative ABC transport system permease protein